MLRSEQQEYRPTTDNATGCWSSHVVYNISACINRLQNLQEQNIRLHCLMHDVGYCHLYYKDTDDV